ncbi:hypothetical protein Tco_1312348 [Tanacetum coccineum]
MKPPQSPKEKKKNVCKEKQKTTEWRLISSGFDRELSQLKTNHKKSRQENYSSHASGSGADEGTGVTPGVPDAPDYDSDDDISWKSRTTQDDEDDDVHDDDENAQDDDDEEQTESEDDGDEFIHPKLTTHDDEIIHEEETDEDDSFDPTIHTPSHISSSDDEDSDNAVEGTNIEGAKSDEDATYEEDQGNEVVEDTNTNLEGRDDVMTNVILPQVQATQEIEDTHVTLTPVNPDGQQQSLSLSSGFISNMLNPNQDTGVDDIFEQHAEATSLIDTPVTAIVEPSVFAPTNRPPTSNPLVIRLQQPPILTPATTPSSPLQNLPNFASLFGFDYRLKAFKKQLSPELRQTNQYAEALSSIPGIVDQYLANKMQEAVDVAVQLKYDIIREVSNTENQQFLNSIDEGIKKVIKEQVKKEVSKITPKIEKLVIDQIESEVLLYKALVDAYEADKILLDTYGDTVTIKRPQDGADDDQEPSGPPPPLENDRGQKKKHQHTRDCETGVHDEQADEEVQHLPDWFQQPTRLPSPDHAWNKSVPATHESVQPWLSNLARRQDPRETFDELTDTTFDFSAFKLEYFCEEVYKATTEKLDWINPEGRQYPHDLRQPLSLVPNSQGRRVIPFLHFINNDLEYLRGGESSRKYSTSVTKTMAADYGHIKWIEDLVPTSMWSQMIVKYDKFALWGISHWGKKRRQFYVFATIRESACDIYSKRQIIAVTKVEIVEWQNYKRLDWITVRRDDDVLYKFKEGDFHRLRIQDIEDMLLLLVQGKVTNLNVEERIAFNVSLRMFTRRVVIQRRVEDLQLGVKSYQKKLNLTKPDTDGTLDDVRTALNDRLKGIRMEYLPQTFWSQRDKANARAMI